MKTIKIIFIAIIGMLMSLLATAQNNVGIGTTTPDSTAALDVSSTTQGFLPPRMTEVQRDDIQDSKPAGLVIWCIDCGLNGELQVFDGSNWTNMIGGVAAKQPFASLQRGADIDGEATGDVSGNSVSITADGSRVAIGASLNDGNGSNSGHTRIYDWNGTIWVQVGSDIDGYYAGDNSGYSVSISSDGSRVAIGAIYNSIAGSNSGHVRVYEWNGTNWIKLGADIYAEAPYDQFGTSVSISADGSRLAIGAPYNDGNGTNSGHVRVYDWSGTSWTKVGADIDGEASTDFSGTSVSISADGSRVAISAPYNDENGSDAGHIRVYEWNGSNWIQVGADIDGEAAGDQSGYSLSISSNGNRVAVGARLNDGNGTDAGHVRIYNWSDTSWTKVGADIDGEASSDYSGTSVSISADGSRVAIGAPSNDGNGTSSGHVRVYDWNGTTWIQTGTDIDGEATFDNSGRSISISANGKFLAIGAIGNDGNGGNSGHVRVYE